MPERINAVHQQPSSQIVWIKALPGPGSAYAQDFLERIAAIAHPIMKAHHLRITTLEEHEPNREFIGRNFNAGEIIQLVLKSQRTGQWLSFRMVQMVMMHELAHCLHMNHKKDFWKVNDGFKTELRGLWAKGFTGEGLWGRGRTLLSGEYDSGAQANDNELPEHLCGGAYRSRRRQKKRKAAKETGGEEETWAQKKQRRVEKKFGANGTALGDDDEVRVKLEQGQKVKGKPRVANSGRGRELRAAAALARFGQQKDEQAKEEEKAHVEMQGGDDGPDTSCAGSDQEYEEVVDGPAAIDLNGEEMVDASGLGLVRVCGSDDENDNLINEEFDELRNLGDGLGSSSEASAHDDDGITPTRTRQLPESQQPGPTSQEYESAFIRHNKVKSALPKDHAQSCPICSMDNHPSALLCSACSHVLDTAKVTRFWRCSGKDCRDSQYINTADNAFCGVCGSQKSVGHTGL